MKPYKELQQQLQGQLKPKRYKHTLGVVDCAVEMAHQFGANEEKAQIAGLLHDCAKNYAGKDLLTIASSSHLPLDQITLKEPQLLHGPVGAIVAQNKYGIQDEEILNAIAYHTTGRRNMTLLDKIIYLADFIEPGRDYPGVEKLRKACEKDDIDNACILAFSNTIRYIASISGLIHPRTIDARNALILKKINQ